MRLAPIHVLLAVAVCKCTASASDSQHAFDADDKGGTLTSVPVDLSGLFNNKGVSHDGRAGAGFKNGSTIPAAFVPSGTWVHDGVAFALPDWHGQWDNVRADGDVVALPEPVEIASVHLVGAGEDNEGWLRDEKLGGVQFTFEDGSVVPVQFETKNWYTVHWVSKAPITAPYQWDPQGRPHYNETHLFHIPLVLPPAVAGKRAVSIRLPSAHPWNALHVFALSYVPALKEAAGESDRAKASVRFVRATRRWEDIDDGGHNVRAQVVEVAIANPISVARHGDPAAWVGRPLSVSLDGAGFRTVRAARIARVMPGDDVVVEVLVGPSGVKSTGFDDAEVILAEAPGDEWRVGVSVEGSPLVNDFTAWTPETAETDHSAPGWFRGAKFGIFIHWGLYSVPAWADGGKYAEWYDYWLHDEGVDGTTRAHHAAEWGEDFVYDDFIPLFDGAGFNASEWVTLFADAGARYFVPTTKHHDGYALFDTGATSDRSTVVLGPKRDFMRELFDTAKKEAPHLHRGTYFSMPEWYNPLYAKYGRKGWPGGLAHSPYTGEVEPYTGFVDVDDYLADIQVAQMRILAEDYGTELMWCDIGMANASGPFLADWYAAAARDGRQVTIDDRCGVRGDFDTPEMEKFSQVQFDPWETCASMDPYSFGYNRDTKDDEYRSATDVIHTLVDITAKGGNFLLNIGPTGNGSIPDAVSRPLLEAGRWLKTNGRAIYDTTTFPLLPEVQTDNVHVEFTRAADAFYIISLRDPATSFELTAPLPILPCDTISLITSDGDKHVPWSYADGTLSLDLAGVKDYITGQIAYVFEVLYADCPKEGEHPSGSEGEHVRDEL